MVGFSEIDKYAITSYCAVHNIDESKNLGDISKVEDLYKLKDNVDLIVGGSPCQDFSIAGKQQGSIFECLDCGNEFNPLTIHYTKRNICPKCNSENLEKTRSSLLIEYLRSIREVRPKYFIYENVKNIIGKKFKPAFDLFEEELREYSYNTYYKVLNAKDYGIPQNRERVFVIGVRKDMDKMGFEFKEPFDSGIRLKDMLEDEVDEKYYINNDRVDKLLAELKEKDLLEKVRLGNINPSGNGMNGNVYSSENIAPTLTTNKGEGSKCVVTEPNEIIQINNPNHFSQRVYSKDGIALTIAAGNNGGGKEPCKIVCEQRTDEGLRFFKDDVCGTIRTIDAGGDKRVIEKNILRYERTEYGKEIRKQYENGEIEEKIGNMRELKPREDGISNTLTTVQKDNLLLEKTNELLVVGNTVPSEHTAGRVFDTEGVSPTVMYRNSKVIQVLEGQSESPKPELVGGIGEINFGKQYRQGNRVYDAEKTAMCLLSQPVGNAGGNSYLYAVKEEQVPNELQLFTNLEGGKWDKIHESSVYDSNGLSPTIPTCGGGNIEPKAYHNYKIRKLTPKECWRLMGFSDEEFGKARQSLIDTHYNGKDRANSQLYKQAGNSIVVDVLVSIYRNLFKDYI